MTYLPTSYEQATIESHIEALRITDALNEARQLLEESGIDLPLENYRGMASNAWAAYVEKQQD